MRLTLNHTRLVIGYHSYPHKRTGSSTKIVTFKVWKLSSEDNELFQSLWSTGAYTASDKPLPGRGSGHTRLISYWIEWSLFLLRILKIHKLWSYNLKATPDNHRTASHNAFVLILHWQTTFLFDMVSAKWSGDLTLWFPCCEIRYN